MVRGTLTDTYVAAVQHDLVDLDGARRLGVVRRPTAWFRAAVDENEPDLAPPERLLDRLEEAREDLKLRGMCEEGAHNAAWENLRFAERYREHLADAASAQRALDEVVAAVASGESIALVCYENTGKKRCHRTILREEIERRLEE
ncbi:MAG: DUF488 family protein [Haloferacaceae archaeon]